MFHPLKKFLNLLCVIFSIREQNILLTLNENFVHLWYRHQQKQGSITPLSDIEHQTYTFVDCITVSIVTLVDFLHSSIERYTY